MNIYSFDYQDAHNISPIIDEYIIPNFSNIYEQISNTNINTSHLIYNELLNVCLDDVYCTVINASNVGGEIRFYTSLAKDHNNEYLNHNTKINSDGELEVWHNIDLTNPTYLQGWKNVNNEISGLFEFKVDTILTLAYLEEQILILAKILADFYFDYLQFQGLSTTARNETMDQIDGLRNSSLVSIYNRVSKYKEAIGIVAFSAGVIAYAVDKQKEHLLILDALNSNQVLSSEDKQMVMNYTSNVYQATFNNEVNI